MFIIYIKNYIIILYDSNCQNIYEIHYDCRILKHCNDTATLAILAHF